MEYQRKVYDTKKSVRILAAKTYTRYCVWT